MSRDTEVLGATVFEDVLMDTVGLTFLTVMVTESESERPSGSLAVTVSTFAPCAAGAHHAGVAEVELLNLPPPDHRYLSLSPSGSEAVVLR